MDELLASLFLSPPSENDTQGTDDANATDTTQSPVCVNAFDVDTYFVYGLIPACVIVFMLGFTAKRKHACQTLCNGRPGLIEPLNLLDGRSRRFSYAAAYGVTSVLCISMFFSELPVEPIGPKYLSVFFNILAVLVYGTFFYPIFASLTADNAFGYFLGSLWVWQYTAVYLYLSIFCNHKSQESAIAEFVPDLPTYACLIYLSVSLPSRCVISLRRKAERKNAWKEHYQAQHVRRLLRKPEEPKEDQSLVSKILTKIKAITYETKPGFRYSTRIVCSFTVAFIILYIVSTYLIIIGVQLFALLYQVVDYILLMNQDAPLILILRYLIDDQTGSIESTVLIVNFYIFVLQVCFIISAALAAIITTLMLINSLATYRNNLLELYKGRRILPDKKRQGNSALTAAAMRFAGYQVAYAVWAFLLQGGVLLLLTYCVACVIVIPVVYGYGDFFIQWFMNWWPGLLIVLALNYIQLILAKFAFLQNWGSALAINNRKFFFIFTYYMFFFNLFVGLISCLMRILKSALIGLVFMSRLDHSSITKRFETMDPGYKSYIGLLYVEVEHTHPALTTFCQVLIHQYLDKRDDVISNKYLTELKPTKGEGRLRNSAVASHRAKIRWFVAYTLIHNPILRFNRKNAIDPLKEVIVNDVNLEGINYVPCKEYVRQRKQPHTSDDVDLQHVSTKL